MPSRDPLARTGRECGCREFEMGDWLIIECRHYDGRAIHLHHNRQRGGRAVVCGPSPDVVTGLEKSRQFPDLPPALEEFQKCEEALLREPVNV